MVAMDRAQHTYQLTIEDAIRERKRLERREEKVTRQRNRERRQEAAGTPLFHPPGCICTFCAREEDHV